MISENQIHVFFFQCDWKILQFLPATDWRILIFFFMRPIDEFCDIFPRQSNQIYIFYPRPRDNFANFFFPRLSNFAIVFGANCRISWCHLATDGLNSQFFRMFLIERFCDFYRRLTDEFRDFFHKTDGRILWYFPATEWRN